MEVKIIKSPTMGVKKMLSRRADSHYETDICMADSIGMAQGRLIDMVYAADIAEKVSGVTVVDIRGNCPQNMILIALLGDTSAVEEACSAILAGNGDEKK